MTTHLHDDGDRAECEAVCCYRFLRDEHCERDACPKLTAVHESYPDDELVLTEVCHGLE